MMTRRGYTGGKVRALLRPLALTVVMLFAAIPAARLACQWVCATPVASPAAAESVAAHHHAGHEMPAVPASGTPAVRSSHPTCEHTVTVEPAVARASVKVVVALSTRVTHVVVAPMLDLRARFVSYAIHSPPGGPAAPLALRI